MNLRLAGWPFILIVAVGVSACHRQKPATHEPKAAATPGSHQGAADGQPDFAVQPVETREGKALWYDVPDASLAARRAWVGEMTAASDKLAQNSYVRVTRLDPEKGSAPKPVVVRVTDKNVGRRDALIEVDRAAANALGMVKDGEARVRVEVLALQHATADKPAAKADQPDGPKASEISGQPAKDERAEKQASQTKTGEKPGG